MLTGVEITTSVNHVRLAEALLSSKRFVCSIINLNVLGPPYGSAKMIGECCKFENMGGSVCLEF